jgi:hypothetical protein
MVSARREEGSRKKRKMKMGGSKNGVIKHHILAQNCMDVVLITIVIPSPSSPIPIR